MKLAISISATWAARTTESSPSRFSAAAAVSAWQGCQCTRIDPQPVEHEEQSSNQLTGFCDCPVGALGYSSTVANDLYQDLHFFCWIPRGLVMEKFRPITIRKACGYTLLALSFLAWGVILAVPLFGISIGAAAALTTGLIIAGEVTFYLGIALLGKDVWDKIKAFIGIGPGRGP